MLNVSSQTFGDVFVLGQAVYSTQTRKHPVWNSSLMWTGSSTMSGKKEMAHENAEMSFEHIYLMNVTEQTFEAIPKNMGNTVEL